MSTVPASTVSASTVPASTVPASTVPARRAGRHRLARLAARLVPAAACLGVLLAAGCTGTGPRPAPPVIFQSAPPSAVWSGPSAASPTTVTILSGADTSVSAGNEPLRKDEPGMYEQLVDWWNTYQEAATGIHLVLDTVSGGATAEHSEMLADAQAGSSDYDIYNLDNEWVPEFAAAGFVRPLPARVPTAGFLPLPLESGGYGGRLYAMPFTTDVGLLYYRTDQVSAAQVKALRSFTDLVKLAGQTVVVGPHPVIGYAGQFADYEGLTVNLLEIMHSDDPDVFAADGTVRDANAVTQGLQQLYDAMYLTGVIPPSELGYTESQAFTAFAGGQALFMRNWPIYYELLTSASVKGSSFTAGHFAVAPLPFPSVLGGQDLAVSAGSRHPSAALRVIQFLTSAQAEQCLFAVGGFPATRGSAYAPGTPLPSGYLSVSGHPLCGTKPGRSPQIGPVILAAIGQAFLRPRTPYYTEFTAIVTDQVPQLLNGTTKLGDLVRALETSLAAAAAGRAPPPGTEPGTAPAGTPAASR